jgi:isocitrate dehydrogenase kinase/phosphatase
MQHQMATLMTSTTNDVFAEYEAEQLANTKAKIAAEDAAWAALPQAEKDRINAAKEAAAEELQARIDAAEAAAGDDEDEDEDEDA